MIELHPDEEYTIELDECRALICKMIEYAVRDYVSFMHSKLPKEQELFLFAEAFIYDDSYRVDWGGEEKSLQDFLEIIGTEVEWFRDQVTKQCKKLNIF